MSIHEQQLIKEKFYSEAMRYMDNAKQCLKNTTIEDNRYIDSKYVKMACGTAYSGLLIGLEGYLILKGIDKPKGKTRKSIEFYQENLSKLDKKMLNTLVDAYQILHLYGYYDGLQNVRVIKEGFKLANELIGKIKPSEIINGN
jgi:hypothetical protein